MLLDIQSFYTDHTIKVSYDDIDIKINITIVNIFQLI